MTSSTSLNSEPGLSDWEIEEGLPQIEDQFIQQYFRGREALIEQETAQRSDYTFRQSLTPLAVEACAVVARILAEEKSSWSMKTDENTFLSGPVVFFSGMPFSLAKEGMKGTKTWQILRKMPKGALLHAHLDAMLDVSFLTDKALAAEGMAIRADRSLSTREARSTESFALQYCKSLPLDVVTIWDEKYQAKQLVSLRQTAEQFPEGGIEGFRAWLRDRCTITPEESLGHHQGTNAIWRKFASCFPILHSMTFYEPIFRAAMQRLLHELIDDGIRWVDFRIAFAFEYWREGNEKPESGYDQFFRTFKEEVEKFKLTNAGREFWGCRIIWSTLRMLGAKEIVQDMKKCISAKIAFPEIIAGYDMVGHEDLGRSLADLTPELFWFRKKCVENSVNIPFFFHAGECLGDGDDPDQNLFDALLLGSRRIGHGFSLFKHPLLIEMVKQKKVLIEVCPVSNEVLRLTNSIKSHPAPALLSRGVPIVLSNDDPAVLGHGDNSLTYDFWQALQGWENLGLAGLGSLAENSVRYAAYVPDQSSKEWSKDVIDGIHGNGVRASHIREWTSEWNSFCEWIITEYAADYGSDLETVDVD